jgi:hypothetical protein
VRQVGLLPQNCICKIRHPSRPVSNERRQHNPDFFKFHFNRAYCHPSASRSSKWLFILGFPTKNDITLSLKCRITPNSKGYCSESSKRSFNKIHQLSPGGSEERHERRQSIRQVSGPRMETAIYYYSFA